MYAFILFTGKNFYNLNSICRKMRKVFEVYRIYPTYCWKVDFLIYKDYCIFGTSECTEQWSCTYTQVRFPKLGYGYFFPY